MVGRSGRKRQPMEIVRRGRTPLITSRFFRDFSSDSALLQSRVQSLGFPHVLGRSSELLEQFWKRMPDVIHEAAIRDRQPSSHQCFMTDPHNRVQPPLGSEWCHPLIDADSFTC